MYISYLFILRNSIEEYEIILDLHFYGNPGTSEISPLVGNHLNITCTRIRLRIMTNVLCVYYTSVSKYPSNVPTWFKLYEYVYYKLSLCTHLNVLFGPVRFTRSTSDQQLNRYKPFFIFPNTDGSQIFLGQIHSTN